MDQFKEVNKRLEKIEKLISLQKYVLTSDEVCHYTGMSRSFLYKLTSTGKIPHSKPTGKLIYFDRKELEEWLLSNPIKTDMEIEGDAKKYCTITGSDNRHLNK